LVVETTTSASNQANPDSFDTDMAARRAAGRDMWAFNEIDFARVAESFGCVGQPGRASRRICKLGARAARWRQPAGRDVDAVSATLNVARGEEPGPRAGK
jgi:hypothetical protein